MTLVVKPKFANLQQLPTLKNNRLNAYCKFTYEKQHQTSKVKYNSSKNPDWDTVLTFQNVSLHGVIWVEIYHQQPPYDVLIATTSISIMLLKLKPFVAKPYLQSTKQVKVGTITVMFEYTPSDIERGMGEGLYQSDKPMKQSQSSLLDPRSKAKQQPKDSIKKYPNTINFTQSNMLWEQIPGNKQNQPKEIPVPRQFIIPPINKNQNETFSNLPSFGPVQSNGYTHAHNTQSQKFLPQPSYQGSIPPGYQTNQFMPFIPSHMLNQNQYNLQNYQISQRSFPPLNYRKEKMMLDPNFQDPYSFSNVTPNNLNYDLNYNANYYQQQQFYLNNANKNSTQNLHQQYHNPHPNYNLNLNTNTNDHLGNKNYGNNQSHSPQIVTKNHSSDKNQPQRTQRDKRIKQSPKKQASSSSSSSLQKMSEKQYEAYLYKKMQQQFEEKRQNEIYEQMVRQYNQRK